METNNSYDYLIIGSGFGGSVSALRLAEKGYKVAVLEAGKRFRDEDFPETTWNLRKFLWAPALRCFGILRVTSMPHAMFLNGTGVGGGSLVYANTLLVPPDPFFKDPQWSGMNDWKSALEPFYETAKKMLGVTPNVKLTRSDEMLRELAEEMGCAIRSERRMWGFILGSLTKPYRIPSLTDVARIGPDVVSAADVWSAASTTLKTPWSKTTSIWLSNRE